MMNISHSSKCCRLVLQLTYKHNGNTPHSVYVRRWHKRAIKFKEINSIFIFFLFLVAV